MAFVEYSVQDNDCKIHITVEVEDKFDAEGSFDGEQIKAEAERQVRQFIPPAIPLTWEYSHS